MSVSIMAMLGGIALVSGLIQSMLYTYPPYVTGRARTTFGKDPNMLPPIDTLIRMRWKGQISNTTYIALAKEIGFEEQVAENAFISARTMLQAGDYITLWRREEIDETTLGINLSDIGMTDQDIAFAKKASEYFPNPQDLVRFAVREVYTPETVSKFGQLEDLPEKFIEECAKVGLPKEQGQNFWASHWLLPSAGQGFEMFQRDVIDEPTLMMLLKALDIMPYWRDKLRQIAYVPFTRVDVRRMHAMGVLDDEGTYDAYRHQGSSPENAEKLLEFTKQYNSGDTKGITRASILKAFTIGLLSESELKTYLEMLGYSEEIVQFWVDMAVYDKSIAELEATKAELEAQYKQGLITVSEYRNRLNELNAPASYVDTSITQAVQKESEKAKLPSRTDLEGWLKMGIISEKYYTDQMLRIGYQQEHIEFYLSEITIEQDTSKRKYLSWAVYQRWFANEIITEDQFRNIGGALKLSDTDIQRAIDEVMRKKGEGAE